MDKKGRRYRPMNGILHRVMAIALGAVLLSGQLDLSVNAQEEAEIYTIPVETETAEDETTPDRKDKEEMEEETAPDEEEKEIEEDVPDEEEEDTGEEIALEEEMSSEAEIQPKDMEAEAPLPEGDSFHVNMLTEPNIRMVCRVIDGENQRVAIEHIVYDGEASDEIEIPTTVSYYGWDYTVTAIGNDEGRNMFSSGAPVTRIKVPQGVSVIKGYAFRHCENLRTVELPDSLTVIEQGAFADCSSLREVNLPDSLTVINLGVFNGCSELTNITLPSHVREIGNAAFIRCSNLTEIALPDTLTTIGPGAFQSTSLEEIWIPDSVVEIGEDAFRECKNLEKVRLPSGLSCIKGYMFGYCTSLSEIGIPPTVTRIGDEAFWYCTALQKITLPPAVTYLGSGAFVGCTGLTELRIAAAFKEENGVRYVVPVTLNEKKPTNVFDNVSGEVWEKRTITFLNENAAVSLTGEDLNAARAAYLSVDDGNMTDDLWYGWKVPEADNNITPGGENPPQGDNNPDNSGNGKPDGGITGNTDSGSGGTTNIEKVEAPVAGVMVTVVDSGVQAAPAVVSEAEVPAAQNGQNQTAADTQSKEPKTGDPAHLEIYATLAMIAGLTYLILYFMEEGRGLSEREKEVFVAAFIRWAKKGGVFRKCCAVIAIFCILVYYHSVGNGAKRQMSPVRM